MRRFLIAVSLVGVVVFATMQVVSAGPWGNNGFGPGCGNCNAYGGGQTVADDEPEGNRQKFLDETTALRRQIEVKNAELAALMNQENPDEKRAASLAGELYDLRNQLQEKAGAAGFGRFGYSSNVGCSPGARPCSEGEPGWSRSSCWQNR